MLPWVTFNSSTGSSLNSVVSGFHSASSHFFKLCQLLNLGSFSVRSPMKAGQRTCLVLTMDVLAIDVYSVSETNSGFEQHNSVICAWYLIKIFLCTSGDEAFRAADQNDVGTVLSCKAEVSFLDWISVNIHLCTVRLQSSVSIRRKSCIKRDLFVISTYAPTALTRRRTSPMTNSSLSSSGAKPGYCSGNIWIWWARLNPECIGSLIRWTLHLTQAANR